MRSALAGVLLAMSAVASPSIAEEIKDGPVMLYGYGLKSCGEWFGDERRYGRQGRALHMAWILGFVSGSNIRANPQATAGDADSIEAYINLYCTQNPLHNLLHATLAAIGELGGPPARHPHKR
jgi:hypothetical protein